MDIWRLVDSFLNIQSFFPWTKKSYNLQNSKHILTDISIDDELYDTCKMIWF